MVNEIFHTTTKHIVRAWYMSKVAQILALTIPFMILVLIFVQSSSEPKTLTELPYYPIILGSYLVTLFGIFIWLIIIISLPRLEVAGAGYQIGRPAGNKDHPIHQGGAIFGLTAIISNTGGRKLTLETMMAFRDHKSGQLLCKAALMPNIPVPEEEWAKRSDTSKFVATHPYCPQLLELESAQTKIHRFYFFVESHVVERLGEDKIADNVVPISKIHTAKRDLIFIDRGFGIVFRCFGAGLDSRKCQRSRLH